MTENSYSCKSQSFSLQWAEGISVQCLYNLLHICLLCLFINVLFVFADDFADFDQVILPVNESDIDNISWIDELQQSVLLNMQLMKNCQKTMYALLTAVFYFELNSLSKNMLKDQFQCTKVIQCHLSDEVMIELLKWIHSSCLTFTTNMRTLEQYCDKHNLYLSCQCYQKQIEFSVYNLNQLMNIQIQSAKRSQWKIDVFLQTIQWFIDQQSLNTLFKTASHKDLEHISCRLCLVTASCSNLKREVSECKRKDALHKKPQLL